jgi:hypothetical protein
MGDMRSAHNISVKIPYTKPKHEQDNINMNVKKTGYGSDTLGLGQGLTNLWIPLKIGNFIIN